MTAMLGRSTLPLSLLLLTSSYGPAHVSVVPTVRDCYSRLHWRGWAVAMEPKRVN